jgi:hypothetical protein
MLLTFNGKLTLSSNVLIVVFITLAEQVDGRQAP